MSKNKLGQDSPFPKFLHLKIRRLNGVESLTTLEEGEFKFAIDGCIRPQTNTMSALRGSFRAFDPQGEVLLDGLGYSRLASKSN